MTDLGRLASDLLLFYTQEFAFVSLAGEFTTGSSIMRRSAIRTCSNCIRGRSMSAQACLMEALGIFAKLPSGYQRDLQLLKVPLFRGIDLALSTLDILPAALEGVHFRSENIRMDESIYAAEKANRLVVTEGIPFREAYRRVGAELFGSK
jgi:argininosuccinate lyase